MSQSRIESGSFVIPCTSNVVFENGRAKIDRSVISHCLMSTRSHRSAMHIMNQHPRTEIISLNIYHWQVSIIFAITPISVPFSRAAATRSLSANCLFTSSAVLCVPSLIRTSTRNRGGSDCSSLTRTPSPITVARLQCVIVGVIRTVTV